MSEANTTSKVARKQMVKRMAERAQIEKEVIEFIDQLRKNPRKALAAAPLEDEQLKEELKIFLESLKNS
jgi:hypothetical protein